MRDCWNPSIEMNPYLFGCIILMVFWLITLIILIRKRMSRDLHEFLWASYACSLLGITEPLFVPEYWNPPSIIKFCRWDFESFIFCFAVGGIAAVITELPTVKKSVLELDYLLWRTIRRIYIFIRGLVIGKYVFDRVAFISYSRISNNKSQLRTENMLLIIFFLAIFGTTAQFGLNIIYDAAIVCLATALFILWRRPKLKWQILGGGLSFTAIYAVVLLIMTLIYPDFYDYWNSEALTGCTIGKAPIEEYLFAFTFGAFWAPLYEAWKDEKRSRNI
ncbi:MAG: hypothetical protein JSU85_16445 [Candidatus Zixiibacteriota bacterium]|nr:MAG: hypothetical protein JSU85_16445 [candidate division Zixibacteria bacterium]